MTKHDFVSLFIIIPKFHFVSMNTTLEFFCNEVGWSTQQSFANELFQNPNHPWRPRTSGI